MEGIQGKERGRVGVMNRGGMEKWDVKGRKVKEKGGIRYVRTEGVTIEGKNRESRIAS